MNIAVPGGVHLPPHPAAVADARGLVADVCGHLGVDVCQNVQLVVSELVANAIRHTGTDVTVGIELDGDIVRVHVADWSPRRPEVRAAGMFDEGGRGMLLVDTIACRWGVVVEDSGKRVWAEVALSRSRS